MDTIRNFSIIAHIDHGKSTLSDCLIRHCDGLSQREMQAQVLDSMPIERERGITIKAQSVTLFYTDDQGVTYQLNFIDTPGHVDFSYEVSRSLSACEGALLVVDAAQSVEAQTVAVCYEAIAQDLNVLPVLNKIDLPQAEPERVLHDIEEVIGLETTHACAVSAKTQEGIDALFKTLIAQIPPPVGDPDAPLQALIIDSWFDNYLGVVSLVRIKSGILRKGDQLRIMSTQQTYQADQVGIFTPKRTPQDQLGCGSVGYLVAGIKAIHGAPVGDTITLDKNPASAPLDGFKQVKPQVYAGLFPIQADDYQDFREALAKLSLNDASLFYEHETSGALGHGFRCGFLGLLHMEIVQERLEQEYELNLITTAPTVVYHIENQLGDTVVVDNPADLPPPHQIKTFKEPIALAHILTPETYIGPIMQLCNRKRGVQQSVDYHGQQVAMTYALPMSEIVLDFFDTLKSISRGYASLDYQFHHFSASPMVKLDILINGETVDALALIVHKDNAYAQGRAMTAKLKELIPRQMFAIAIQAAIGNQIIARETVKALRKNVIAKCYGGDVSRKKKLLAKQKAGKKRMKQVGKVSIPQEAFLAVLQVNDSH